MNCFLKKLNAFALLVLLLLSTSCSKYLDMKPDDKLAVPTSLQDFQLMLDNYAVINRGYPASVEVVSDNYYVSDKDWESRTEVERNLYHWVQDANYNTDWLPAFKRILSVNTILDNIDLAADIPKFSRNSIKGAALFIRGYTYYSLAQAYAQPYVKSSSDDDLGLPMRLDSDFNKPSIRKSVSETYTVIIKDLKESLFLLPHEQQLKTQPNKAAVYGALAKVYLAMGEYVQARLYADSCLNLSQKLMDFSSLDTLVAAPIRRFNDEVIYHALSTSETILNPSRAKVDSLLYKSYAKEDLRRKVYFKENVDGSVVFKGDYDGIGTAGYFAFWGITTSEMFLIRAEGYAREGRVDLALQDLNTLLSTRYKKGKFVGFTADNPDVALRIILNERRKELAFRASRWTDLRRLSKEESFAEVPLRQIKGEVIKLLPNSSKYTLFIPAFAIDRSGMQQNP